MTDIKIRLTGSEDFGVAEIELSATDPQDALNKLQSAAFHALAEEAVAQQVLLAKSLKASHGLTQNEEILGAGGPIDSAWHPSQPAQPPAWAQPQPSNVVPIQQSHGDRRCEACGQPLIAKTTSKNQPVWRCDAWRYNNGNPNNHTSLRPGEGF